MKINRKSVGKIIILLIVIVSIIILVFTLQKSEKDKINTINKNKSVIKTEDLDKNDGKIPESNDSTVPDKSVGNVTSADNKDTIETKEQEKDETTKAINNDDGITAFIKVANFGSIAEIVIDSSKFNSSYKYYQFSLDNKPISAIESVAKSETSIFPAQKAKSEAVLSLLDKNKKIIKRIKIILNEKK